MIKVLKTDNNFFVAFPDDVILTPTEVAACKASKYNDAKIPNHYLFKEQFPQADSSLTRHLQKELQISRTVSGTAVNELADNTAFKNKIHQTALQTNSKPLFADYTIADSDLPSGFAQSGIPLRRTEDFYFPKYDEKQKCYVCHDALGTPVHGTRTRAAFDFKTKEIFIHDKVFFFSPEDAETIQNLNRKRKDKQLRLDTLPPREKALYIFYFDVKNRFCDSKQKYYSVCHEFKHALTNIKIEQRKSKPNYEELSPTQTYLFNEDDEKAAHLQETCRAIAAWYKSGGNLGVFPEKCRWLTDKLKTLSPEQQKQLLSDEAFLVDGNIENWNQNHANIYTQNSEEESAQLVSLAMDQAYDAPALRIKDNDREYIERRSIAYTIDVYNPETQKFETKDMSRFIAIPNVVREHNLQNIETAEAIVRSRKKQLEKEGITPELIEQLQNGTYKEAFQINTFQTLRQQVLDQGITFKSKNLKGEEITIKADGYHSETRPNGIKFTSYKENNPIFGFVLDLDKKEYNCFNYRTKQKYSNATDSKHPRLPEAVKTQIKKYLKQIQQHADALTISRLQNKNKHKE